MSRRPAVPLFVAALGIATYALMDALMKGLAIALGAYSALFWRLVVGLLVTGALHLSARPRAPPAAVLRVHAARAAVVAVMAIAFFWGIARVPLAEAIALSFIAPLIALGLAAVVLKERVAARSIGASALGLVGVAVILSGRLGGVHGPETGWGMAAVLLSAVFYAVNLVMARHQAQLARPLEIAFYQSLFVTALLSPGAVLWVSMPPMPRWPAIVAAAALAIVSLLLLSWAYARAEAQYLLAVEYSAFIWAAATGWFGFGEPLTLATLAGAALIVAGCLIAARRGAPAPPAAA